MKPEEERAAVAKVAAEIADKHPEVPAVAFDEIVDEEYHALDGRPVRDFVPPLVGHAVRERLRHRETDAPH